MRKELSEVLVKSHDMVAAILRPSWLLACGVAVLEQRDIASFNPVFAIRQAEPMQLVVTWLAPRLHVLESSQIEVEEHAEMSPVMICSSASSASSPRTLPN